MREKRARRFLPLLLSALLLALALLVERALTAPPRPDAAPPEAASEVELEAQLVLFDVGQGNAALLYSPEGRTVLIDGGRSRGLVSELMLELGLERLDLVIASHADLDHIGGLAEAVRAFEPRFYLDNGVPHTTQAYARLLEAVDEVDAVYLEAEARTLTLGSLELHILPPPRVNRDQNDNSVGVVLAFGDFRAVFPGDATTRTQTWWLENFAATLAGAQVYKAAHHGSSTGDRPEFMQLVSPDAVVISVGAANAYGHPAPEALASYESVGARVYRTDQEGHITITASSGGSFEVTTGGLPALTATPSPPAFQEPRPQ